MSFSYNKKKLPTTFFLFSIMYLYVHYTLLSKINSEYLMNKCKFYWQFNESMKFELMVLHISSCTFRKFELMVLHISVGYFLFKLYFLSKSNKKINGKLYVIAWPSPGSISISINATVDIVPRWKSVQLAAYQELGIDSSWLMAPTLLEWHL